MSFRKYFPTFKGKIIKTFKRRAFKLTIIFKWDICRRPLVRTVFTLLSMRVILPFFANRWQSLTVLDCVCTKIFSFLCVKLVAAFLSHWLSVTLISFKIVFLELFVFSLPDYWVYKTLTGCTVTAYMGACLFFRFSLTLPTKKLGRMTFAWTSPNSTAQSQCLNATT